MFINRSNGNNLGERTQMIQHFYTAKETIKGSDIIFVVSSKRDNFANLRIHDKSDHQEQPKQQSHAEILRIYLLFAYCLCISPFRIVRESNGTNVAKRWTLQLILCSVVTIASLFTSITDVRKAFPSKDDEWNPVIYFRIFYTICSFGLSANAFWSLWRKSDRFVAVVHYLDSTKSLPQMPTKISLSKVVSGVCFIYACLGLVSALLGSELMESRIWTPYSWVQCLALEGRYNFFTGPESNCNETVLYSFESISSGDHVMAAFTAFGQLFKFITSFYWELLILFGVLSLWLPAAAFARGFQDENDNDEDEDERNSEEKILEAAAQWPCIEEQYLSLKDLSDLINNAFGAMVFSYTFSSIFYYSINLDAFLLTSDILKRIRLIVLYLGAVILYILAADVCRQVGYLETWLAEYADDESKSNVPFHRLTVILNELSTNTIGISGWNVFTVTYSVVANMTSVLITYFIICVQFRTDNK